MGFRKDGDAGRFTRREQQRAAARQRWLWVKPDPLLWDFCPLSIPLHTLMTTITTKLNNREIIEAGYDLMAQARRCRRQDRIDSLKTQAYSLWNSIGFRPCF